jgi:hypothetical protein
MSRQNLSRANQTFSGRATFGPYQADKPGVETQLTYRWKPLGVIVAAFTAGLAAGATSGTLSGAWAGPSGLLPITFSDGETLTGLFTNGSPAVTFWPASAPFTGGGYGAPTQGSTANTGPGATVNAVTAAITVGNIPPQLGVSNNVAASQSITLGVPGLVNGALATAGVATMDVPRTLVGAWTGTAVVTVTGTDYYGQKQTESSASGTTYTGKKAFATVTGISVSASVTGLTLGTGNALGLPFRIQSGDWMGAFLNDVADAGTALVNADNTLPATALTGDVRGTYTATGALNGQKVLSAEFKVNDNTTQWGAFGVTPF